MNLVLEMVAVDLMHFAMVRFLLLVAVGGKPLCALLQHAQFRAGIITRALICTRA